MTTLRVILLALAAALVAFSLGYVAEGVIEAHSTPVTACRDAGRCVCTEPVMSKGAAGYVVTADADVTITCINMDTQSQTFHEVPASAAPGATHERPVGDSQSFGDEP